MRPTLDELIERDNVEFEFVMKGSVPNGWAVGTNPWEVTLRRDGKEWTLSYYTGPLVNEDPSAHDVIDCLLSDASSGDQSFEDYCGEFDFNPDSREDHATWEACKDVGEKLRTFLGDAYDEYMQSERD